jgi:hypothetical protein
MKRALSTIHTVIIGAISSVLLLPAVAFAGTCTKQGVLLCLEGTWKVNGKDEAYVVNDLRSYLVHLLADNMGYVMVIAIVLVVFSGIHYMTAMGQPAEQTKAKQRILGILGGVIFYFMITYISKILIDGGLF